MREVALEAAAGVLALRPPSAQHQGSQVGEQQDARANHLTAPDLADCLRRWRCTHGRKDRAQECCAGENLERAGRGREGPFAEQIPAGGLFPHCRVSWSCLPCLQESNHRDKIKLPEELECPPQSQRKEESCRVATDEGREGLRPLYPPPALYLSGKDSCKPQCSMEEKQPSLLTQGSSCHIRTSSKCFLWSLSP